MKMLLLISQITLLLLDFVVVGNLYFTLRSYKKNKNTRKSVCRLERRFSTRSFELFYLLSFRGSNRWSWIGYFWINTLIVLAIITVMVAIMVGGGPKVRRITTSWPYMLIVPIGLLICNWSYYLIWSKKWVDKVKVNPQWISPEISFLKTCEFYGPQTQYSQAFIESAIFLANVANQNLTKRKTKRRVLKHLYQVFMFFSQIVDDELINPAITFASNSSIKSEAMIKKFDEVLVNSKIEVKILRRSRDSINHHRLRQNV